MPPVPHPEIRRTIRIVLVDDHAMIRETLARLFERVTDVDLVGLAGDGEEAVAISRRLRPEVVIVDWRLPGMDGFETTRRIRAECPDTKVLVLTTFPSGRAREQALEAGATGIAAKSDPAMDLVDAVRAVAAGAASPMPRS